MRTKTVTMKTKGELDTTQRVDNYYRALYKAIQAGATYKELLEIKPGLYELPETWLTIKPKGRGSYNFEKEDQATAIQRAIAREFLLDLPHPLDLTRYPGLYVIAEEMKAPYSVIMGAYKLNKTGDEK